MTGANHLIDLIKNPDGNSSIHSSVSDFCGSMGYCELRINHHLKGIQAPQTKLTIEGAMMHEKEEIYEKEHFKFEPVTKEALQDFTKDVEFAREGVFTRLERELSVGQDRISLLVYGRADKVLRSKGTLIIEDSKFPESKNKYVDKFEPFDDQKLQALLYLNSKFNERSSFQNECFDIACDKRAWIINVKDKATMESIKIFQGYQTKEAEEFLNQKITSFAMIVMGKLAPTHHGNPKKCASCRFNDCEYKLT
jgi:hypothetical protein